MEIIENSDSYSNGHRVHSVFRQRERHLTPNFFQKKLDGVYIKPLPYKAESWIIDDPMRHFIDGNKIRNQNLVSYSKKTANFASAHYLGLPGLPPPAHLDSNLESNLLSKINTAELNVAMAWFERKDTFAMINALAYRLANAATYVRRGKWKKAARELGVGLPRRKKRRLTERGLDKLSDNWLEYRYGWMPLYYDIHNAAKVAAYGLNKNKGVIKLNTGESIKDSFPYFAHPTPSGFNVDFNVERERSHRIGIHYKVLDPVLRFKEALGLRNPHLIAWELLPLSFVLDWFLPLSDELRKITAYDGLHFMGGYESWKEKVVLNYGPWSKKAYFRWYGGVNHYQITPFLSEQDKFGGATYTRELFERRAIDSFGEINLNPWRTENGLNVVRALDSIALFHKAFT